MEDFNINFCCFITLYVAIVPANACQHTKFKLSSSISFGHMRGRSENKKCKCAKFQVPSSISYGDMEGDPE